MPGRPSQSDCENSDGLPEVTNKLLEAGWKEEQDRQHTSVIAIGPFLTDRGDF